jgi:hypothetical protein
MTKQAKKKRRMAETTTDAAHEPAHVAESIRQLTLEAPAAAPPPADETPSEPADVVEQDGQKLRRISPRQMKIRERQERKKAAEPPPAPPETPIHTAYSPEPDEEDEPELRESMSFGEIEPAEGEEFPDTAGRGPPRNLTDICATYPLGNGLHYIRVERQKPQMYLGVPCAGFLGEIRRPTTEREFQGRYGGGTYKLIVYGPDPRGRHDPVTTQPIIKALTKEIPFIVPGLPARATIGGMAEGRSDMQMYDRGRGSLPATSAEAAIHRDALHVTHEMLKEERNERRTIEAEARRAPAVAEPIVGAIREAAKETSDILRDQLADERRRADDAIRKRDDELRALRQEIDKLMRRPTEASEAWSALSQVAGALAPGRSSSEELTRIHDAHRHEILRLEDQHKRELDEHRRSAEDRIRILQDAMEKDRERGRVELKEEKERAERRERDLKDQFDQRMRDKEAELERRLKDMEERNRHETERLRQDHDRELKSIERQNELIRTTEKQSLEGQVRSLKDRIELLKEEVDKAREESESKGDFVENLVKFEKQAEALGFSKRDADEPRTWQERIADAVGKALQNADKIVAGVADVAKSRAQQAQGAQAPQLPAPQRQPPQQQMPPGRVIRGPGGQPQPARRTPWSTEDISMGTRQPGRQTSVQAGAHAIPEPPPQPPRPAQPPPPPAAVQATAPTEQPPPPTQPGQPVVQQVAVDPVMLEQFRLWAETEIDAKADPAQFAVEFVTRIGSAAAHQVLSVVKIEQLFDALSQTKETLSSPILRRDGQKFMRTAWTEAKRISAAELGLAAEPETE